MLHSKIKTYLRPLAFTFGLVSAGCVGATLAPDVGAQASSSEIENIEASPLLASVVPADDGPKLPISFSTLVRSGLLSFSGAPSQCIDVLGINRAVGAQVYAHACNAGVNQQFAFNQNQLVVYGNRCLEWTAATETTPSTVRIGLCESNKTQQMWLQGSDSAFHAGSDANLCLGAPSIIPAGDVPLEVTLCNSGNALQHFSFTDATATLPNLSTNVIPMVRQPTTPSGVAWIDPPANAQLFPSSGSLDWSRYFVQGAVGDCTFMSGLGAIAGQHHELVRSMIKNISPHLYEASFYHTSGSYQTAPTLMVKVQIDDKLPIWQNSNKWFAANPVNDEVTNQPVLFTALLEKAFALYVEAYQLPGYPSNRENPGYAGTVGNSPAVNLTLAGSSNLDTDRTGFNANTAWPLLMMVEQGYPVTTYKAQATADNLPGGHVLFVLHAYTDESGKQMVTIRNPWGQDHNPSAIKLVGSPGATFTMPYATYIAEFNQICVGLLPGT